MGKRQNFRFAGSIVDPDKCPGPPSGPANLPVLPSATGKMSGASQWTRQNFRVLPMVPPNGGTGISQQDLGVYISRRHALYGTQEPAERLSLGCPVPWTGEHLNPLHGAENGVQSTMAVLLGGEGKFCGLGGAKVRCQYDSLKGLSID